MTHLIIISLKDKFSNFYSKVRSPIAPRSLPKSILTCLRIIILNRLIVKLFRHFMPIVLINKLGNLIISCVKLLKRICLKIKAFKGLRFIFKAIGGMARKNWKLSCIMFLVWLIILWENGELFFKNKGIIDWHQMLFSIDNIIGLYQNVLTRGKLGVCRNKSAKSKQILYRKQEGINY